ncbi:hypothetical protein IGI04_029296 [Brassica rapa subsp. trilocularis]|uniref:Uncharacterized protein n=1 Tax=Brassica rapa subsp. trilocularis TaxID=1813537 RepID=A0ABQ7LP63_BRACM|nr:hypothetical protein IGI04_029296 [Brassica rapa subsp. trilocularis]
MLGVLQKWTLGVLQKKGNWDYFSDYLRQRKDLAGDGMLQLLEKSSYGSMLFTSVTTNSSRRDKELLEKDTIPMETEDKSASGKANDVNNAKKIKAYMDKVYTERNLLVEKLMILLPRPSTIFFNKMKGNTITAILHKKPLITIVTTAADASNFSVLYYEIMSSP